MSTSERGRPGNTGPGKAGAPSDYTAPATETERETSSSRKGRLVAQPLSSFKSKRTTWLLDQRIPCGALVLLAGSEGIGKSVCMTDYGARATRGELDGEYEGRPVGVLYVASEDSAEHVVKPRFQAADADMSKVHVIAGGDLVLPRDEKDLTALVDSLGVKLVVLDPATSVMDSRLSGDSDRQMRQALEPAARVAQQTGAAVVGIAHWVKKLFPDPKDNVMGSKAWSQVARSCLSVMQAEDGEVVMTVTKANYTDPKSVPSLAFRAEKVDVTTDDGEVGTTGRVTWLGEADRTVHDLLAVHLGAQDKPSDKRQTARDWLYEYMRTHRWQVAAADVEAECMKPGMWSYRTMQDAAGKLGIRSEKIGDHWYWSKSDDQQDAVQDQKAEELRLRAFTPCKTQSTRNQDAQDDLLTSEDEKAQRSASSREDDVPAHPHRPQVRGHLGVATQDFEDQNEDDDEDADLPPEELVDPAEDAEMYERYEGDAWAPYDEHDAGRLDDWNEAERREHAILRHADRLAHTTTTTTPYLSLVTAKDSR